MRPSTSLIQTCNGNNNSLINQFLHCNMTKKIISEPLFMWKKLQNDRWTLSFESSLDCFNLINCRSEAFLQSCLNKANSMDNVHNKHLSSQTPLCPPDRSHWMVTCWSLWCGRSSCAAIILDFQYKNVQHLR